MKFVETPLKDAYVVELERRGDDRGFFARAWCQKEFADHGLVDQFVQMNMSTSVKSATLRGFHYQVSPHEEAKLVRCIRGSVFDAIIDMRPASATYQKWFAVELAAANHKALFVPPGFAHGYQTLEPNSELLYQVSAFYEPASERGIRWNDPTFGVEWPIEEPILSDKDLCWPDFVED